jgi:hypothetical protein
MALLLGLAWRLFDRAPNDPLIDARAIESSSALAALAQFAIDGRRALAALLAMAAVTGLWGAALARPLVDGLLAAAGAHP